MQQLLGSFGVLTDPPSGVPSPVSADLAVRPLPLQLEEHAARTLRSHRLRPLLRVATLFLADATGIVLLKTTLRAVRESLAPENLVAALLHLLVPSGIAPFVQIAAAFVAGLLICGAYGPGDAWVPGRRLYKGVLLGSLLLFWSRVWEVDAIPSIVGFVCVSLAVSLTLTLQRYGIRSAVRHWWRADRRALRVVAVGRADDIERACRNPVFARRCGMDVVGSVNLGDAGGEAVAPMQARIARMLEDTQADTLVLCGQLDERTFDWIWEIADDAGCQIVALPRTAPRIGLEPRVRWRNGVMLMELLRPGRRGQHLALKRAIDVAGASIGLLLIAPVIVLVGCAVRVSSAGPVLFTQERVGQGGRTFRIYKFRTMVADADAKRAGLASESLYGDARLFKLARDPRVTPLGAWLRRTSLDELPQLWNVLRGDMSLVGPRPPLPSEVALYAEHHYARFYMKPGMTGPWQVSGRNTITEFDHVVQLERNYMRGWTMWRDVEILLRTVPAVMRMTGAC